MMQKQTRLYLQKAGILAAVYVVLRFLLPAENAIPHTRPLLPQSIWFCGTFCLWFFLFSLRG